jgi:hypothetical protein
MLVPAIDCGLGSKWPFNWPANAPVNTLLDRAHFRAISRADSRAGSDGLRPPFRPLVPSPSPFCTQHREHPRVSRSRPHNHEKEGVSGKLEGAAKTWVTDRCGLSVLRGTNWSTNLQPLGVLLGVRHVKRTRQGRLSVGLAVRGRPAWANVAPRQRGSTRRQPTVVRQEATTAGDDMELLQYLVVPFGGWNGARTPTRRGSRRT